MTAALDCRVAALLAMTARNDLKNIGKNLQHLFRDGRVVVRPQNMSNIFQKCSSSRFGDRIMSSDETGARPADGWSVPPEFAHAKLTGNLAVPASVPQSWAGFGPLTVNICIDDPTFGVVVLGYMTLGGEDPGEDQGEPPVAAEEFGHLDLFGTGATGGRSWPEPEHSPYDPNPVPWPNEESVRQDAGGSWYPAARETGDRVSRDWSEGCDLSFLLGSSAQAFEDVRFILDDASLARSFLESFYAGFSEMENTGAALTKAGLDIPTQGSSVTRSGVPANSARGLVRLVASGPGEEDPTHPPEREDPAYELRRMFGVETPGQDLRHGHGVPIPRPLIPLPPVRSPAVRPEPQPGTAAPTPKPSGAPGKAASGAPKAPASPEEGGHPLPPKGFSNVEEFRKFGENVRTYFAQLGYNDVQPILQGSAVTGFRYKTGEPFDTGEQSDLDIAIVSPTLLRRAKEVGIPLRSRGTRTGPLQDDDLKKLGLNSAAELLGKEAGREVHFMIYDSSSTATRRSSSRLFGEEK